MTSQPKVLWQILVDDVVWDWVLAVTQQDAYDLARKVWDRQHGRGDFDRHTVGVRLAPKAEAGS